MNDTHAYARFPRRLRALLLDATVIATLFYVGAVVIHSVAPDDHVSRALWIATLVAIVLYEPVLVALLGGTIGHRITNLQVVDDRTDGNLAFFKAVARTGIKGVLGWASFASMTLTRRNQALHDVLTRSTVRIRDRAKASLSDYVTEREVIDDPVAMPSRMRRVVVIAAYSVLAYVLVSLAAVALLSEDCEIRNRCSPRESTTLLTLVGIWLIAVICSIIFGWKGRLWGCRVRLAHPES